MPLVEMKFAELGPDDNIVKLWWRLVEEIVGLIRRLTVQIVERSLESGIS